MLSLIILGIIIAIVVVAIKGTKANLSKDAPVHARIAIVKRTGFIKRITFQLDDGTRIALQVSDAQASMMMEGDTGVLTYHGDFFKAFVPDIHGKA